MTDPDGRLLAGLLAILASFGSVLVWLVKRFFEKDERQTERFLTTMETLVSKNTESKHQMATAVGDVRSSMIETTTTLRELMATNREEHRVLMDAIGKSQRREGDGNGGTI